MKDKPRGGGKLTQEVFNEQLLAFLRASPTPFHATRYLEGVLRAEGYREWKEAEAWKPAAGDKHYVKRNESSIIAFHIGAGDVAEHGFRITGAHTDSPCLKLKPHPEIEGCGLLKAGVEIYGGVLLSTWFDRDLSLAGRVSYLTSKKSVKSALVDFARPIAVLPNLAIHLNREVNDHRSINKQYEMPPILCQWPAPEKDDWDLRALLAEELRRAGEEDVDEVVDFELSFYDTQSPGIVGLHREFISSARLDNLLSCFTGVMSVLQSGSHATSMVVCNDHEEVGSSSTSGAQGTFLRSVLERLSGGGERLLRAIDQSLLISTDNAHAIHPNYPEKHDPKHAPLINNGPVLKINACQRYATNSETAAVFALCCRNAGVPLQRFVARADMGCGSTIGPITASELGIRAVDVGVPTLAMHSIRELAGVDDPHALYRALVEFHRLPRLLG